MLNMLRMFFHKKPTPVLLFSAAFERNQMVFIMGRLSEFYELIKDETCMVRFTLDGYGSSLLFFLRVEAITGGSIDIARMAAKLDFIFKS